MAHRNDHFHPGSARKEPKAPINQVSYNSKTTRPLVSLVIGVKEWPRRHASLTIWSPCVWFGIVRPITPLLGYFQMLATFDPQL